MRDIHCPKDIGFENTFSGEDCEKEQHYNNCYHCWKTALARRDEKMTYYKSEKQFEPELKQAYDDGLNDAWECAKKLMLSARDGGFNRDELQDIFGHTDYYVLLKTLTASEAMSKIKEYTETIRVGDEVCRKDRRECKLIVTARYPECIDGINFQGSNYRVLLEEVQKTGRHFPQIKEVLKQMQEEKK